MAATPPARRSVLPSVPRDPCDEDRDRRNLRAAPTRRPRRRGTRSAMSTAAPACWCGCARARAWWAGARHGGIPEVARTFVERLAPRLIGEDPLDRERLLQRFYYDGCRLRPARRLPRRVERDRHRPVGPRRQAAGQPIAKLIGGVFRDRVEAYASGPFLPPPGGDPVAHYLAETERYVASRLARDQDARGLHARARRAARRRCPECAGSEHSARGRLQSGLRQAHRRPFAPAP